MASHNSNLVNLVEKTLGTKSTAWVMRLMTLPAGFDAGNVQAIFKMTAAAA